MRRAALLGAIAIALLTGGAQAAGELTLTVVSQNNSSITLGWQPQTGYGYLFSVNGTVVSRTNDPNRSQVRFGKVTNGTYEVATIVKGATGTYPPSSPPPPPPPKAQCQDSLDNDSDGKVDYPNDPGCSSATDNDETDVAPPPPPPPPGTLLWKPPTLTNPITLNVSNSLHEFSLNAGQDYIIKMPSTPLTASGGLVLIGGRNIVIIGGEISRPNSVNDIAASYGIALYRQTGTVHIEGMWVHGVGIGQAILIAHTDQTSANSVIQVENTRLESLHQVGDVHTDTIQSYGGPGQLRLFQDTLISNGVTLQTQPCDVGNGPTPHNWDYRRLNLVHQTADAYALWKNCTPWSEFHQDIWLKTNPNHVAAAYNSAWAGGNCWTCWNPGGSWPITGETIKLGLRPQGDWVPVGAAGIGYVSPGYQ